MKLALIVVLWHAVLSVAVRNPQEVTRDRSLWNAYDSLIKSAKHIDLTHAFQPNQPTFAGFSMASFGPTVAGRDYPAFGYTKGVPFTYDPHGFIASSYVLPTDQYGTQLDPPAHWNKMGATISDLPPTYAVRPLVVINVVAKVVAQPGYFATKEDVLEWEAKHGQQVPKGSVVMFRTDWYKKWDDATAPGADQAARDSFINGIPGVGLEALKFLHLERQILVHGHEPLDTGDFSKGGAESEGWLLNNNYAQAEGVANLDKVPEAGALVSIGFAKPLGGTGGFARYVAIAPADWPHGVSVDDVPGAPLPMQPHPLVRDADGVLRPTPEKTEL